MERLLVLVLIAVNGACLCVLERVPSPTSEASKRGWRHLVPNVSLTALLLAVNVAFDRVAALASVSTPRAFSGPLEGLPPGAGVLAVIVTLDGLAYVAHLLLHKLPFAWRVHRVHHSDPDVDVSTAFRQHPLETVWRHLFQTAGALLLGASTRAVAIYLSLSALNAQMEHAQVSWPPRFERWMRLLFVTPPMHRVHHSRLPADTDTNYSNIFSLWDRLFGTFRAPRPGESIPYGLDALDAPARQRMGALLALPFA